MPPPSLPPPSLSEADGPACSVEMLTTLGPSLSASATKSGKVSALVARDEVSSRQNGSARAVDPREPHKSSSAAKQRMVTFPNFEGIRTLAGPDQSAVPASDLNVFHSEIKENRVEQRLLVVVEISPRLVPQHPQNIDKLLCHRQVAALLTAGGIGYLTQMHQRFGRKTHQEGGKAYLAIAAPASDGWEPAAADRAAA